MSLKRAWIGFWILGVIWGSSYLFIRIGVEQIPPFQLVFIRTAIAAVGLTVVVYLRGKRLPTEWHSIKALLFLGIVNTVIPFALITWGETHIESGLASVLQGTTPLQVKTPLRLLVLLSDPTDIAPRLNVEQEWARLTATCAQTRDPEAAGTR